MDKKENIAESGIPTSCNYQQQILRRHMLRDAALDYVQNANLTPPLSLEQLDAAAEEIAAQLQVQHTGDNCWYSPLAPHAVKKLLIIMVNNALWYDVVAAVPFENRLLLLPQCLRNTEKCIAEIDEFGLLCLECGNCQICTLQQKAEELGYMVLIAEGTTAVTGLLEKGDIDAVIGVSCIESLEKSFPTVANQAIPGVAVPLLCDGCEGTTTDLQWLLELINCQNDAPPPSRIAIDVLRAEVHNWFSNAEIQHSLQSCESSASAIAAEWLAGHGKRWRPFLTVAVNDALSGVASRTPLLKNAALATECFHKASLIHDDIEDADDVRYGAETLHKSYGLPIALNVGDFLLGEGYRLIAEVDADPVLKNRMLTVVSQAHRELCIGQGEELAWARNPQLLTVQQVIDIFRRKTAPAFEISLRLGAICAGMEHEFSECIHEYSCALGIAYQIHDDITDFHHDLEAGNNDVQKLHPSLLLALFCESCGENERSQLKQALQEHQSLKTAFPDLQARVSKLKLLAEAQNILKLWKRQAFLALNHIQIIALKSLLTRLLHRIVPDV